MTGALAETLAGLTGRGRLALAVLLLALAAAPLVAGPYVLSVLILCLWLAYVGQAWNLMMGFAGQLSLGHSLYVGLGAYVAAGLFVHGDIGPWAGVWAGIAAAAAAGAVIGALGFRFGVRGVHFALLTIAFAEFTRIGFDHIDWLGGSGGLFLPVDPAAPADPVNLRGGPLLFYYVILALTLAALVLCAMLVRSRLGYYWQALREDQDAAAALGINVFRAKLTAVVVSAALTAPAGVFQAFYFNNLYPEQTFAMSRSVEMVLGSIIGGIGTLFGPVFGAFVLTPLGEVLTWALDRLGLDLPGAKLACYGVMLVVIVCAAPQGLWPGLAGRLGLVRRS